MKKKFLLPGLLAVMLLTFTVSCKKSVIINDENQALALDSNFVVMSSASVVAVQNSDALHVNTVTPQTKKVLDSAAVPNAQQPNFYIFNYVGGGFTLVAADKRVDPILAFSEEGHFELPKDKSSGLNDWIGDVDNNMRTLRKNPKLKAPNAVASHWRHFKKKAQGKQPRLVTNPNTPPGGGGGGGGCVDEYIETTVGPLVQSTWGQGSPYNDYTPLGVYYTPTPAGCVATGMAQIMRYWQYPTSYSWTAMPLNSPSSPNSDISQLMIDIGSSVGMIYTDAISAPPGYGFENAFKYSFGYSSASQKPYSYSAGDYNIVISDINASRPVLFGASSSAGGHLWVCDGYYMYTYSYCPTETTGWIAGTGYLFHMNWGWDGYQNGYYAMDNWAVLNGSTVMNFTSNKRLYYNIYP